MFYLMQDENNNSREMVDTWLGYNHNYRIGNGEWYDMENLSSDLYPLMSPRSIRASLIKGENIRGLLISNNMLTYLDGTTLHYGTREYNLSDILENDDTQQQLIRYGAYIVLVPAMVYVNVVQDVELAEHGKIEAKYTAKTGTTITYTLCDKTGAAMDAAVDDGSPANPKNGDYWLKTKKDEEGLYLWQGSQGSWVPVATCYIKIEVPGANLTEIFSEGDAVYMNTKLPDINSGSIIQAIADDYIVVIGIPKVVTTTEENNAAWQLKIERKVPELDYVCVCDNRLWGCYYGPDNDGGVINEIFACKQGDLKNWNSFAGIATDSYYVSVGDDGAWTGCIAYGGTPIFFKENRIYRLYGSQPSEYQLSVKNGRGVQQGSYRSLAVVAEYLMYKSASGPCIYDGSTPVSVAAPFGRDAKYYDAVAGAVANKYYLAMQSATGARYQFVYDMEHGVWEREDAIGTEWFTGTESGQMYATDGKIIYGIGSTDNAAYVSRLPGEEYVRWWAETGDLQLDLPEHKSLVKLAIRAYIPHKSEIQVQIRYNDEDYQELDTIRSPKGLQTHVVYIPGNRECDHYRLKFIGHGAVRIYSMMTEFIPGTEEHYR